MGSDHEESRFDQFSLVDYLQEDPRPTFAIELKSNPISSGGLNVVFSNKAFQGFGELLDSFSSHVSDERTAAFVSWATAAPSDKCFQYNKLIWTVVTIHQKWRIISGSYEAVPNETLSTNNTSHKDKTTHTDTNLTRIDKAQNHALDLSSILHCFSTKASDHCLLILSFDWATTPLGPMCNWPQQLVLAVGFILCSPEPSCIFWGSERTIIYNEEYTTLIQSFHPAALGTSAKHSFASFWSIFEAICQEVEQTEDAIIRDEQVVLLDRSRGLEEIFFTYAFVPMFNAVGNVCGILNRPIEITKQVVAQRQMTTLINIGEATGSMTNLDDYWKSMFVSLSERAADLPYAAVYALEDDSIVNSAGDHDSSSSVTNTWYLKQSIGFPPGLLAASETLENDCGLSPALKLACGTTSLFVVDKEEGILSEELFHGCVDRGTGTSFSKLVICQLSLSSGTTAAWLILGLSPVRPYDGEYQRFIHLLARQIRDTATSVVLLEKETRRLQRTVEQAKQQQQWLSEQLLIQTKEAQDSDLRFFNFAKQAPVGVYVLGPHGEVKFSNDAWYKLIGMPLNFQAPIAWRTNVHPDDLEAVDQQWEDLTRGKSQTNFEWRRVHKNAQGEDEIVYLRSSCFPELADDGTMKSVTGILMDVSVHRAHEKVAAERLSSALEAKRAQENFMDMVSHEMRNPLNAILQCAEEVSELLNSPVAKDKTTITNLGSILEAVDTIQYCGQHQKQIIDDVLTISKLDSNLLTFSPLATSPVNVVEKALKVFASEIRAEDISLSQHIMSHENKVSYLMDPSRVLQILINLVGNAIKFMKGRPVRNLGIVTTTSSSRPKSIDMNYVPSGRQRRLPTKPVDWGNGDPVYISFSVKDTGPGLTSEEMNSLFARFQQASPRTHAQYGGSGLGLFISRELAELHGGEIGLTSQVQKGSTFAFYVKAHTTNEPPATINVLPDRVVLPTIASNNAIKQIALVDKMTVPSFSNLTVLIVEDNLVNQKVLNRQLTKLGFKTITANHGGEALAAVRNSRWWHRQTGEAIALSVVLCDIEMPIMDGLVCVREIRRWQKDGSVVTHVPMIAVTGNARTEQVEAAKEAGFDNVVCKPFSVPNLVPLMCTLISATR